MQFIDEATITIRSGDGGRGCVSFRREKFVPRGGPDGGNGGNGGSVFFVVDPALSTLLDFRYRDIHKAKRGLHGKGKNMTGRSGQDLLLAVPGGTVIYDAETGKMLADLIKPGETYLAAKGGRGGRGNSSFTSSTNQTPETAEPGEPGVEQKLRLELKLIAKIGLVGLPNAGKSTLISRISRAKPKIADYPFTTLSPVLGVVSHKGEEFVVADLPGLIEGAHRGAGLGRRFLKHVERAEGLVHVIDAGQDPEQILNAYHTVSEEMELFQPGLSGKPTLLVFNKMDLTDARKNAEEALSGTGMPPEKVFFVSAATGEGIVSLLDNMLQLGRNERE